eukprot:2832010-Pyramimonas_sp.AAC.1
MVTILPNSGRCRLFRDCGQHEGPVSGLFGVLLPPLPLDSRSWPFRSPPLPLPPCCACYRKGPVAAGASGHPSVSPVLGHRLPR